MPRFAASDPDDSSLRIITVNCGGLAGKLPQLLHLLLLTDPDILCLQEVGSDEAAKEQAHHYLLSQ